MSERRVSPACLANRENGTANDAEIVVARLEEAGRTLLSLPSRGFSPGLRTNMAMLLRHMTEVEGGEATAKRLRPAVPSAAGISRMDEALAWVALIPREQCVLRRIVGARALVDPVTGRHLYPWRRLGALLGADHKAVQRWHARGIAQIVDALSRRSSACRQADAADGDLRPVATRSARLGTRTASPLSALPRRRS